MEQGDSEDNITTISILDESVSMVPKSHSISCPSRRVGVVSESRVSVTDYGDDDYNYKYVLSPNRDDLPPFSSFLTQGTLEC